ncbi:MAG: MerR family transcriptional regulator [Streptosporangiaceae bacterium]
MTDYRIDELAHAAGTTVRNVRSYQDRGLLPAPRLQGRVGLYAEAHLARLRLIGQMLERGYTLAIISDLITAWENGREVSDVLGLEQVLTGPWTDEIPGWATFEELLATFGNDDPSEEEIAVRLARTIEIGLIEVDGDRFRVPSPRLLHVGAELVAAGIPLVAVLEIADQIRQDCDKIASRFVHLVDEHILAEADLLGSAGDVARVAEVVRRMRPLVQMVVNPFVAQAMETRVRAVLGDKLEILLKADDAVI